MSGLISGLPPDLRTKLAVRDFVPKAAQRLTDVLNKPLITEDIPYVSSDADRAEHVFWGRVATEMGQSCLVDADQARRSVVNFLKDRSSFQISSAPQFLSCADFAVVTPQIAPVTFEAWGELKQSIRHFCAPVIKAGAHRIWEHGDVPSGHISIASQARGLRAEDVIAKVQTDIDGAASVRLGGDKAQYVDLAWSRLAAQTEFTPVDTLNCEGFDVLHITVEAERWPLIK